MDWFEIFMWSLFFVMCILSHTKAGFHAGKRYEKRRRTKEMDFPIFKQPYGKGPLG